MQEPNTTSAIAESPFLQKMQAWILTMNPHAGTVDPDADLMEQGILDSMAMVNFLLYIEELREREIPEKYIQPEYWTSLRVIHNTFLLPDA